MKFSVNREELLKPLQAVTSVVERRQTLPVLANVLVRADESGIELTGTDLEVEMVARVAMAVENPGEATIPARKLMDIWRALPDNAQVTVSVEGDRAVIKSGRSRFNLATLPPQDFPKIEEGEADVTTIVSDRALGRLVDKVSFAMAQQDVRYFLNGMLLELSGDYVRAVATDGHRLAMCTLNHLVENIGQRRQAIVPRKAVLEISRLLEGDEEDISLRLGSNHLRVGKGPFTLTTKLVDGQFPDYDKVIPKNPAHTVVADRDTLRQGFQRASILSNEKYRGVRLLLADTQMTIKANNPEQEEAEETVSVAYGGEEMEIGFNVSYLLDVLGVVADEQVTISVTDANSSALIDSSGDDAAVYVVMPMRL